MRNLGFSAKVMIGYAIVILLLVGGLLLTFVRMNSDTTAALARIGHEEREILLAERLRWNVEVLVSSGRGYLVSGDRELLEKHRAASAYFDQHVRELREEALDDAEGMALLEHVDAAAARYARTQSDVFTASRATGANREVIARRFRAELLPDQRFLARALDRFVAHKEAAIAEHYAASAAHRSRVVSWMAVSLGGLVLLALGIAGYFSTLLSAAYRREHRALLAAEGATEARDELMAIIAHDLRSPLGAITMNAGILAGSTDAELNRKRAATIENVALRMSHLINSLLDFGVLGAGRLSIVPEACNVEVLLQDALQMHQSAAEAKDVRLVHAVDPQDLDVFADRERLLQVLSNLLGNALKFTPSGGEVRISAERQGEQIRFDVRDSGPGIAEVDLPHVFDRFWKRNASRQQAGAGLGLFIAKGIVEAHDGRIWVENAASGGAEFHFTLPAVDAYQRAAPSVLAWQASGLTDEG